MRFKLLVLAFLISTSAQGAVSESTFVDDENHCESAKEFITTYEYLRDSSDLAGSGDNAVKVASQVAEGCTGAAKRFIQTLQILNKVELPLHEILATSISFAKKENANVEAFNYIFKRTFAEDGFDLDLNTSLKVAKAVSVEFNGNVQRALVDFQKVSEFCSKGDELFLSKPECADLAKRIALYGKEKKPAAGEMFIKSYQFLKTEAGVPAHEAMKLAEQLVQTDPGAFENFRLSYEYAMAEKGLKANKSQAIRFGKKMADLTVKKTKTSNAN